MNRTNTLLGLLQNGDKFYFQSDKKKIVYCAGIVRNKIPVTGKYRVRHYSNANSHLSCFVKEKVIKISIT